MASGRPFLRHVRLAAKCERLAADASLAFERAGYSVLDDPPAGKARADSSVVMQAIKLERGERVPAQTRAASAEAYSEGPGFEIITALILVGTGLLAGRRGAKRGATGSRPEWLEVYDVSRLVPTGFELYVRTDGDASDQLDSLAEALALERRDITIRPRRDWQGYGWAVLG